MKIAKTLRNVTIWIIISLIIQGAGFFYVDKYFLATDTSFKAKKVEAKKPLAVQELSIVIPADAINLNLSFDGKYMAYYENDSLKIINTLDNTQKSVEFDKGIKVSYYKWLPDRDRMLIAEKQTGNSGSGIDIAFYDVTKNQKEDIKSLTWADSKDEVTDISLSAFTNVIYIKVSSGGNRSNIYWLNIMKNSKKIYTKAYMIGNIGVLPHEDKLVYQDLTYKKIYVTNVQSPIVIKDVKNPYLLSVDGEDNIYIGSQQDNKITKIYHGLIKQSTSKWNVLELVEPQYAKDIFITSDGKVLVNDNLRGIVTDQVTSKQTIYSGTFLQLYDEGVASISNGKLVKTVFAK